MYYKSSFNALIIPYNKPYIALYDLMNNYNLIHYNTHPFIVMPIENIMH